MKKAIFLLVALGMTLNISSFAQEDAPMDEVISKGSIQIDPAMSAWNAGDYAVAEIEFERNAMCALRAERNFISSVESAQNSSENATSGTDISGTVGAVGTPSSGGSSGTLPAAASSTRLNSNNFKNKNSASKRTCEDRGFQIYMIGLSQLKLGKTEDAKKSLIRAAAMRKDLWDAHFRIALLEYQDGNLDKVRSILSGLKNWNLDAKAVTPKVKLKHK